MYFPCCIPCKCSTPIYIHRVVFNIVGYYSMNFRISSRRVQGDTVDRARTQSVVVPGGPCTPQCSKSWGMTHFLPVSCVLSHALVLCLLLKQCFLSFWCFCFFPFHFLFSAAMWFGLMEPEVETEPMGAGVVVSIVHWFKEFLRSRFSCREDINYYGSGFCASLFV